MWDRSIEKEIRNADAAAWLQYAMNLFEGNVHFVEQTQAALAKGDVEGFRRKGQSLCVTSNELCFCFQPSRAICCYTPL